MTRKRTIRTRVGFDSEDDGAGRPLMFAFVHERGSMLCDTRDEALFWLRTFAADAKLRGLEVEAWATNLEYDLVNLFGGERVAELQLQFGRSALCGARWRGRNVVFRDTMRHLPAGVERLGELVGMPKLEVDLFKGKVTRAKLARRCTRDAAITARFAGKLSEIYATLGERPRMTLASTAMALWRSRYWRKDVQRPTDEIWEAALESYHGGRTEVFALGDFKGAHVIDAASMFAWSMVAGPFPVPWGGWLRITSWRGPSCLYRARLDVPQGPLPRLPYRSQLDGTVYPVGRFEGWFVGEDLAGAARAGARVSIIRGYEFHSFARPFTGYVADLFKLKSAARGPMREIYKALLVSLYGKFGQQGRSVRAVPLRELERMKRRPDDWWLWNELAVFMHEGTPPPWGNNLWSSIVTARARQRLADEIERVNERGGRALYCDTDSVVYLPPGPRYARRASRPGQFERRGVFRVVIVGKKEYALEDARGTWTFHAKGVPYAAREQYLRDGRAEFRRPTRLREAMRRGVAANVWGKVEKVRHVSFEQRARMPDGSLLPILVGGAGE